MRIVAIFSMLLVLSSCGVKNEKSAQNEDAIKKEYLKKGGEIAEMTQAELLKNVSQAMQKGGPGYAIEFCNLRAMSLKDSLSKLNTCEIRRIAVKYRNPADMPRTKTEKDQLSQYLENHRSGKALTPEVYVFDDRIEYYKPILINNAACLVCHGEPGTQITAEIMEVLKEKYPNDLATGFALNDFRGAWQISFQK